MASVGCKANLGSHRDDVRPLVGLLLVVLLREQGDDRLGQEDLVVLIVRQAAPNDREHEHPEVVGHLILMQHHLAQRLQQLLHLVVACNAAYNIYIYKYIYLALGIESMFRVL